MFITLLDFCFEYIFKIYGNIIITIKQLALPQTKNIFSKVFARLFLKNASGVLAMNASVHNYKAA